MSNPPPISVLMAVYNGQSYLRQALDSVLTQTFTEFEFIIINDGSTDGTQPILEAYSKKDSRIRLISQPNKGLPATLNEGIALARGEFIARMDADDICMPTRFEKQLIYLREHPNCVLLGSRVLFTDSAGLPIREGCLEQTHEEIDFAHLNRGWPMVHPAVMMRAAAVRQVGGYRNHYDTLEDMDLFLRLADVGRLANHPQVLLHYRQHFASITHSKADTQMRIRQSIYDETYARRGMAPPAPPPPGRKEPRLRHEQHNLWAWTALKAGNIRTARKHAFATLTRAPFSRESWRVMMCAIRGR